MERFILERARNNVEQKELKDEKVETRRSQTDTNYQKAQDKVSTLKLHVKTETR
jgi:hypothetical protein